MKVIQSYIPYKSSNKFMMERQYAYIMMLSSLLLKKNYGNITLYTNKFQKEVFKNMGFVYDYNTDILEREECNIFVMPKLLSCLNQNEPFIHYDLDTLVFNKPNIENNNSSFIFSHPDITNKNKKINIRSMNDIFSDFEIYLLFKTYTQYYFEIKKIDNNFHLNLDDLKIKDIPNMNCIIVKNYVSEFKSAIQKVLKIYKKYKSVLDMEYQTSTLIEQFLVPYFLKKNDKDINTSYLFTKNSFNINKFKDKNSEIEVMIENYKNENKDVNYKDFYDYTNNFNLNDVDYLHIGGANKLNPMVEIKIIKYISENFGDAYLKSIFNFYKEITHKNKKENELTVGETLYQEIFKTSLFTDLNYKTLF